MKRYPRAASMRLPWSTGRACVLTACIALALLSLAAAPASATKTHLLQETFGSVEHPSFGNAEGVAVDQSSGDLLVVDAQAKTISRYNPDGTPDDFAALGTNVIDAEGAGECPIVPADCDQTPENGFRFGMPVEQQIAVDHSGTLTDGDIYVTQVLYKGILHLVDIFAPDGHYLGQITGAGPSSFGEGNGAYSPCGVAVDSGGNLFIAGGDENKIYKYVPVTNPPTNTDYVTSFIAVSKPCSLAAGAGPSAGSLFVARYTFGGNSVSKLDGAGGALKYVVEPGEYAPLIAVDSVTGHVYAVSGLSSFNNTVNEYDASGSTGATSISTFATNLHVGGIAVDGARGKVYLASQGAIKVYGPLVTVPDVSTGGASLTGETSVTLEGTVNPDGVELEECYFEYGTSNAYGQAAPCSETPADIGISPKEVHANISSLGSETLYHYRLVAKNPNATVRGLDETFKTPSKPAIDAQWAINVGINHATLKATINPENSPTTYRFEWGLDSSYGQSTTESALATDAIQHTVSNPLAGLVPGTTYHWRVVATNNLGITAGFDRTFTTFPALPEPKADCPNAAFRSGPSANLPDCRAYEMVSPVDKNGSDISVLFSTLGFPAGLDQSATDGDRFAYSSQTAFGDAISAPYTSQYVATREAGTSWSTHAIAPPREPVIIANNTIVKFDVEFKAFSPDLSDGWLMHTTDPQLDGCAVPHYLNIYRRDQASEDYEAVTTVQPPTTTPEQYLPELQGLASDGGVAVFAANGKLTKGASSATLPGGGPIYQLYEHVSGAGCGGLRLVSVLPNGKASNVPSYAGALLGSLPGEGRENTLARAVSSDGARIFWTAKDGGGPGPLYVRIDGKETVQISAPDAQFWTAAADGSKAIYTVGEELYQFDVDSKTPVPIAAGVAGVAAASEDASQIYFVSSEALAGGAEAGKPNLYLYEAAGESTRFVATLAARDLDGNFRHSGFSIAQPRPIGNGVRATPDGRQLAFVSTASPTGYDNADAADGRPDVELFLYDADTAKLACVSCNPSGARPAGREVKGHNGDVRRVAAQLPPWESDLYAPRALSADGSRLFFESFDPLLPGDVNGAKDVYEWEQLAGEEEAAKEECLAVIGGELYVPQSGGCLSLISTGQSPSDSSFVDASTDGGDVFIKTGASLLPQDPGLVDVYDARVEGGFAPEQAPPAVCEGEACQSPPEAPNDPTPASSAFEGAGNVHETAPATRTPCAKGKVHRKGKCVAKHHKRAKRHHTRAANHNRRQGR